MDRESPSLKWRPRNARQSGDVVPQLDPDSQRRFAIDVVKKLRAAGHVAYWAGGCVRDQLLGRPPKDYDVATDAVPEQIRQLFGRRRTLAVGAAFGVVVVMGPRPAGQIDVATFRRDAAYSDGRHPDAVVFSTPEEDARRRDFTINGLFYDPVSDETIDFVAGQEDLKRKVVRAIGDPHARIAEDKLRMLRAVRFAATFGFEFDADTYAAIQDCAEQITVVSAERIAAEMRAMLVHPSRAKALELLRKTGLLKAVLPEVLSLEGFPPSGETDAGGDLWQQLLQVEDRLKEPSFPLTVAAALKDTGRPAAQQESDASMRERNAMAAAEGIARQVCRRWRLSNKETDHVAWLVRHQDSLENARQIPFSRIQRLLIDDRIDDLLSLVEATALARGCEVADVVHCRNLLTLPVEELNPAALISGHDLIKHGIQPGSRFQWLLETVRDAQLDGQIDTAEAALRLVDQLVGDASG